MALDSLVGLTLAYIYAWPTLFFSIPLFHPMCKHSVTSHCWIQGPYPIGALPRSPLWSTYHVSPSLITPRDPSLTGAIDLSQLGATPWKCTLAADDSFIRKGGHGRSASFPSIKGPKGDEPWIELITFVEGINWVAVFFKVINLFCPVGIIRSDHR